LVEVEERLLLCALAAKTSISKCQEKKTPFCGGRSVGLREEALERCGFLMETAIWR
jgi:hypothetical protein